MVDRTPSLSASAPRTVRFVREFGVVEHVQGRYTGVGGDGEQSKKHDDTEADGTKFATLYLPIGCHVQ